MARLTVLKISIASSFAIAIGCMIAALLERPYLWLLLFTAQLISSAVTTIYGAYVLGTTLRDE